MNTPLLIVIALALLLTVAAFFGFIGTVPKAFQPQQQSTINGKTMQRAQQDSTETTQIKHRQLMEDMKQKIADQKAKNY